MSSISYGAVFSRSPLEEADLARIDVILARHAEKLQRTRKGRQWRYERGAVLLGVHVEDIEKVLWDCEDDLVSLDLLPQPGHYRVSFTAGDCSEEAAREIERLIASVAAAIDGLTIGPRHSS